MSRSTDLCDAVGDRAGARDGRRRRAGARCWNRRREPRGACCERSRCRVHATRVSCILVRLGRSSHFGRRRSREEPRDPHPRTRAPYRAHRGGPARGGQRSASPRRPRARSSARRACRSRASTTRSTRATSSSTSSSPPSSPASSRPSSPTSCRARASRELLESGIVGYFEHLKADPEHEQAMLELTQYALRSPERRSARARPVRAVRRARRALPRARRRGRRRRRGGSRSRRWRACSSRSPTDSPSPGSSIATTTPPGRSHTRPPTPSREWPTPDDEPRPRPARARAPVHDQPVAALGEPVRRVSAGWIGAFATVWLGVWMAQLTPVQLLLPAQIDAELHPENWVDSVVAFGTISGIAAIATVIAYPLTGALSDRTASRFGRRRPWIVVGALVFALSLVVLGLQTEIWAIGAAWVAASVGFCIMTAALTATISDQVPVGQRGFVSGWMSAPQAVGIIVGLLLVTELVTDQALGYALLAVIVVVLAIPFLTRHDEPLAAAERARVTAKGILAGFWISPAQAPRLRLDPAQPRARLGRQRARHEPAALLPDVPARRRRRRGRPHRAHAHLHGVRDPRVAPARPALRPPRPTQGVRLPRLGPAGLRGAAPRDLPRPHRGDDRRRHPRPRLRLLPLGRPGARHPGAARRGLARQGPRHHEHRVGGAAGDRPADRRGRGASPPARSCWSSCSAPCSPSPAPSPSRGCGACADGPRPAIRRHGDGCRDLARSRPLLAGAHRRHRSTSTRRSARSTSARCATTRRTWCAARPARRSASRRSRCACAAWSRRSCSSPGTAACSPTRSPRRSGWPTRSTTSWSAIPRRSAAASAGSAPTPTSRAGSRSWSTRRSSSTSSTTCCPRRGARRSGCASSSTRRGTPRCSGTSACAGRPCTIRPTRARSPRTSCGGPGFRLVGMMSYEAQIAGVVNRPAGRPVDGAVNRWMQSRSLPELLERRARAVAAVREHADLEFVNGGGTGLARGDGGGCLGDRDRRGLRPLRRPPVRRLRPLHARAGRRVRARRRALAEPRARDDPRRRLDRIGPARSRPRAADRVARGTVDARARIGRRGADAGDRRRRGRACVPATGCGSGTPSRASCRST